MKKFVYEYYNDLSAGEREERGADDGAKEATMKWFNSLGAKLADGGNPFGPNGMAVTKNGADKITNYPALGYSIVNAADMDSAVELAKGCPLLMTKGAVVRVYEALPM